MCKMKSNNKVRNHSAVRRELSKYEWQELNLEAYIDRAGWTKISFARRKEDSSRPFMGKAGGH